MRDLIKITENKIGLEKVNCANARNIHEYLGVKTKFSMWINRAIEKYDFVEDEDFSILKSANPNMAVKNDRRDLSGYIIPKNGKNSNSSAGRPSMEYIVTLDMAKELAMLENNVKGKEVRKYFIKCEKELYNKESKVDFLTYSKIAELQSEIEFLANANANLRVKTLVVQQEEIIRHLIKKGLKYDKLEKKYLKLRSKLTILSLKQEIEDVNNFR